MIGLVKASVRATTQAIHSLPATSWASRNIFRATSAPNKHMKATDTGHQSWNQPPTTQAGISSTERPGLWKLYSSLGGRAWEKAGWGGRGYGAAMPTKSGG